MTVALRDRTIVISGRALVEDAEPLTALLQEDPARAVDLTDCSLLHTAVLQVLLALRPQVIGPAGDGFAQAWCLRSLGREA